MTNHDRVRKERAEAACSTTYPTKKEEIEALEDAIRGLQSTDDPSLCPLHDELMKRYQKLTSYEEGK